MQSWKILSIWAVVFLATATAAPAVPKASLRAEFRESDGLVLNPDCGWVAYDYEDGYGLRKRAAGGEEPFRFASVVYTRHPSRAWEDEDGGFEDSAPLKLLQSWMANGRHVAFRVYANGPGHLPPRYRGEAKTFSFTRKGKIHRPLVYWDAAYVEEHRRLVRFLGERLGDSPYLAFVDIGGVGNTGGEWFFSPLDAFVRAGLDDETLFQLVESFVAMYTEAFPRTPLFISYECVALAASRRADVISLLEQHRIGVRDDNLGGWPYPRAAPPRKSWPMQELWRKMPVLFECGGAPGGVYGIVKRGENAERVLDWAFTVSPPTHINIGGAESVSAKACAELPDLLTKYGRRLGYRFVLLSATCPSTLRKGRAAELRMTWANRGVAPCYTDRQIEATLFDADGRLAAAVGLSPEPPTSQWAPGRELDVRLPLVLPNTAPAGTYTLKVGMLLGDPRDPGRHVALATEGGGPDHRYAVGSVDVAD